MRLFMSAEEKARRDEIERQRVDAIKTQVKELLAKEKDCSPDEAKRLHGMVKDKLNDKGVPREFKEEAKKVARELEKNANMRATEEALKMAVAHAKNDRIKERGEFIKRARDFKRRAMTLGGSETFETAVETQIEQIRDTGRVSHHGKPTRAKPKETAPVTPNRAKETGHDKASRR